MSEASELITLEDFTGRKWQGYASLPYEEAGYRRTGGCGMCGACCTGFRINRKAPEGAEAEGQFITWLLGHFPMLKVLGFSPDRYPVMECTALGPNVGTEDQPVRLCTLRDDPSLPLMCREYPSHPQNMLAPSCCYRWEPLEGNAPWERPLDEPELPDTKLWAPDAPAREKILESLEAAAEKLGAPLYAEPEQAVQPVTLEEPHVSPS